MSAVKELFKRIKKVDPRDKNLTVTVVSGSFAGAKALLLSGRIYSSDESFALWLKDRLPLLLDLRGAGQLAVDGQTIYYELLAGKKKLVICGAGHVGLAVTRLGKLMGYHVTVIDDRPELCEKAVQDGADTVKAVSYAQGLLSVEGDPDTCFVFVTRGHYDDMECLKILLKKEYAYIGLMGSRKKAVAYRTSLLAEGYSREVISDIHMPVGIRIGAETPEEIAVSIMAEIIEVCRAGDKRFGYDEDILDALIRDAGPMVLATVISKEGLGPRSVGAKMLVFPDGSFMGTVGGGVVEARTLEEAGKMLREVGSDTNGGMQESAYGAGQRSVQNSEQQVNWRIVKPRVVSVKLKGKDSDRSRLICDGKIDVLLEYCGACTRMRF